MSLFFNASPVEVDAQQSICRISGVDYPIIGAGTYPFTGEVCTKAVSEAIKIGYRIFDTATVYNNFAAIAKAFKDQDRRHFYFISKVWHDMHAPDNLRKDLVSTLEQLQIDYLDAYFLHWPNSKISIEKTLLAMEELRQQKKIRHIGLSNVTVNHLKRALEVGVPLTWVQVEMHPYFYDAALVDFCRAHSIVVQAWRPLALGRIGEDKMLNEIGKKYAKTPYQVALKWSVQHGCVPIPASKDAKHLQENLEITNFQLSTEEIQKIDQRAVTGSRFRLRKEQFGFDDEFDFSYDECWP